MCLGEVVRLESVSGSTADARVGGRALTVSLLTLEEPVLAGDWVLVHSGFALQRLDPREAADALSLRSTRPAGPGPGSGSGSGPSPSPDMPPTPSQEQP